MPTYRAADGRDVWSDRELTDAELATLGMRRSGVIPDGGRVHVPQGMMDAMPLAVRANIDRAFAELRTEGKPTMMPRHQVYTADQLTALKDAENAAFYKSVDRLNAWRTGAHDAPAAASPRVHDAASEADAFGKSVAVMNTWRNPTGA